MLTELSWRQLPPPDTRAVDPACLPSADESWSWQRSAMKCLWDRATTECLEGDRLRIGSPNGRHRMWVKPWPKACVVPDKRGLPTDLQFLDGLILTPALARGLRAIKDPTEDASSGDPCTADILADLQISRSAAARSGAFSESFPPGILEDVARWPVESGRFALAAACGVPGFRSLLNTHPQLAWLVADRILRNCGGRGIEPTAWEAYVRKGPLWLASAFLGLPRGRGTLAVLRRLHLNCFFADGLLESLRKVFARSASRAAILRLGAPIRNELLCLLENRFVPNLVFLRALQQMGEESKDGRTALRQASTSYMELAVRVELGRLEGVDLGAIRSPRRILRIQSEEERRDEERALSRCPLAMDTPIDFPFAETPGVLPLRTRSEILAVGARFNNCLGSALGALPYLRRLADGTGAVAIFCKGGAEALVFFRKDESGRWVPDEIGGPNRTQLDAGILRAVDDWCRAQGIIPRQRSRGDGTAFHNGDASVQQ
ncbi:MAG: hypothetical protein JJU00_08205 [Opitutales bacterium]|nr:hypothetical protein [Opitutales bacterium]